MPDISGQCDGSFFNGRKVNFIIAFLAKLHERNNIKEEETIGGTYGTKGR